MVTVGSKWSLGGVSGHWGVSGHCGGEWGVSGHCGGVSGHCGE